MRLIDADALIKEFERLRDCDPNDNHYMGYASHFLNSGQEPSTEWDCVDNALENAPTVDAAPVAHGQWIDHIRCSCCGWMMLDDVLLEANYVAFPYCPNCGAKMKENTK